MKRLIFFAHSMQIGGLERALLNLLNVLIEKGYSITLVLEHKQGELLPMLDSRIRIREYRLSHIGFSPLRRAFNLLHRVIWFLGHRNHYDFSCAFCTYSVIGSVLAKYASRNSALYVHSNYDANQLPREEMHNFFRQLGAESFANIIFVSNESQASFLQEFPELTSRCTVINNLVDIRRIRTAARQPADLPDTASHPRFIFVGRLEQASKRFDRLFQAFAKASALRPEMRLWLVGDGKDRAFCQKLVNTLGIEDRVAFIGSVDNPYPYMSAADCLLLSSDYEGFPVVYHEALLLGLNIIGTVPVSAGSFEISTYAEIVDKSADALAAALLRYEPHETPAFDFAAYNMQNLKKLTSLISNH